MKLSVFRISDSPLLHRHIRSNIIHKAIRLACHKHDIDPGIIEWVEAMLVHRTVIVESGLSTITVKVAKGCPQGGVLPPLLWCLVINEVIKELNDKHYQTEGSLTI